MSPRRHAGFTLVPAARALSAIVILGMLAPPAAADEASPASGGTALEEVVVYGRGSQVELPPLYAGDQIARGGRVGLFGNLDMMQTPFSSTNYSAELMRNQQSVSVADVLRNDPAVRVARGFGNFQELYIIRGLPVFPTT